MIASKPKSSNLDRLPPQNVDLERVLIGCILRDAEIAIEQVCTILKPESFYEPSLGAIYRVCAELYRGMRSIDVNTVSAMLADRDQLVKIGGKAELHKLQEYAPYDVDLVGYAKEIHGYYLRRQLIVVAPKLTDIAHNYDYSTDEVLQSAEQELFRVTQQAIADQQVSGLDEVVTELLTMIEERSQGHVIDGVKTGFFDLDDMTNGFSPGDAVYVIARPAMGKTVWGLQSAFHIAQTLRRPVAYFSLEMSKQQLVMRLVSSYSGITSGMLKSGRVSAEQWEMLCQVMADIASVDCLKIDDKAGRSIDEIASQCRRIKSEMGDLAYVVIDHMHLIDYRGMQEMTALAHITKTHKTLARELEIPIVMLAQLNRGVEGRNDKRPVMSDIRQAGTAEQDADIVIGLYRDEYYNPDTPDRGIAEQIILKHRNGPVGTVKCIFEPEFTRFKNLSTSRY